MMEKSFLGARGSLIFQAEELVPSNMSRAIIQSFEENNKGIYHVGIMIDQHKVIEADPEFGVREISFKQYITKARKNILFSIANQEEALKAVNFVKKQIGLPYNHSFNPDSKGFYCSELIASAYPDFFEKVPMTFRWQGEILPFWEKYFMTLGENIPEGLLGTHPKGLFEKCLAISEPIVL